MGDRALIYTRVSKDQAGGRSPQEQETEARAECARRGWEVAEVVTDTVGASRHSKGTRGGWARAKELVRSGEFDVLVTWEASRAQRDLEAYTELRRLCVDAGVRWSYSGRVYDLNAGDDRFRTGLDALLSEREAEETATRVKRAIRANAVAGRPHGRRLFGYRRIYDPSTGALVGQEPVEPEASLVRRVFNDYLTGGSVTTIATTLNKEGVSTATGRGRWSDQQVRDMLTKPSYTGLRVHQGVVIGEAGWEPIIDRDTFEKVQARLAIKRTYATRQTQSANLLSGTARCGVCNGRCYRGHDRLHRKTYACRTASCVSRDLVALEAYVTTVLLERLSRPDAAVTPREAAHLVAARAELESLLAQLDEATNAFTSKQLSAVMLGRVEAQLTPKIAEAKKVLRRGVIPIEIDVPADDVDGWWDALTPAQRREVVGAVIEVIVIHPVGKGARVFNPDAIEIRFR